MTIDEEILTILEKKEKKRFLNLLQNQAEKEGNIPPMPFLFLKKTSLPLQYAGGILLGIFWESPFWSLISYFLFSFSTFKKVLLFTYCYYSTPPFLWPT